MKASAPYIYMDGLQGLWEKLVPKQAQNQGIFGSWEVLAPVSSVLAFMVGGVYCHAGSGEEANRGGVQPGGKC